VHRLFFLSEFRRNVGAVQLSRHTANVQRYAGLAGTFNGLSRCHAHRRAMTLLSS